jgi:hypothetical protein
MGGQEAVESVSHQFLQQTSFAYYASISMIGRTGGSRLARSSKARRRSAAVCTLTASAKLDGQGGQARAPPRVLRYLRELRG